MVKVQRLFAKTNLKIRVCGAKQNNESPSGDFKRPNGLAQQDGGALPRQVPPRCTECRQYKERHGFPAGVQKCAEPQKMENPTKNLTIPRWIFVRSRELESLAL